MSDFTPFANESQALSLGKLSVENHEDKVSIFGSIDLTKDKKGLAEARRLKAILDATVKTLETTPNLPAEIEPDIPPTGPRDPFA